MIPNVKGDDTKRSIVGIVVAYRSAETIGACVTSLFTHGCEFVIVVDNAADPYTELAVKEAGPRARYYAQKTNLGFAAGCNVGVGLLPSSPGQWLAFVNPDVWIYADLKQLVAVASAARAAVVAGRLHTPGGNAASNARPRVTCARQVAQAAFGSRVTHYRVPSTTGNHWIPAADGALLLISREVWRDIGGFDERFELYFEDADLCERASDHGGVLLVGVEAGHHIGGESFNSNRGPAYRAYRCSRVEYLAKYFGFRGRLAAALCAVIEAVTRTLARCPEGDRVRVRSLVDQLSVVATSRPRRFLS